MVKDGRGSILVNNKDLMDNIARGIFGDDEESGLCLAHLNQLEAKREVCVFYRVKNIFNDMLNSVKQLVDIQGKYVSRLHAHWYLMTHD